MPITWTQSDIDTLQSAIAKGVKSVTYSGPPSRTVEYQSLEEMRALLADMAANVDAQGSTVSTHRVAGTKKGF